ncbi:hypothetical protein IAT38_002400 [Cryptococcus sp. DSM 104549]
MASPEEAKDGKPTVPQLHPFYCWGDVHLLSSDGVLLVIDSRALTRISTVFRDMVETTTAQDDTPKHDQSSSSRHSPLAGGSNKETPIDMGESSTLLVKFLDMITSSRSVIDLSSASVDEVTNIMGLCDKFDCVQSVTDNIKNQVIAHYTHDPWNILILASQFDDIELGVKALELMRIGSGPHLDKSGDDKPQHTFWDSMRKMTNKWQAALLRASLSEPIYTITTRKTFRTEIMKSIG